MTAAVPSPSTWQLPTGAHRLQMTYGPAKSGADIVAPMEGMTPGALDVEVTFPLSFDIASPGTTE